MAEPARTAARDDIAPRHRPDTARSSHSSLRPTGTDRHARGQVGSDRPAAGSVTDSLRRRLGVETIPPGTPAHVEAKIHRIERLADWLDTRFVIPVINWPIGLDGIVGLIPGVGDTITTGLSGYLMYEAHQCGARKRTLARMGWNVCVDWVLGSIPLVGDIFDVAHKANARNARLLLDELRHRHADTTLRTANHEKDG